MHFKKVHSVNAIDRLARELGESRDWLIALRDNPEFLLHTPAAASFPGAKDLDRAVRHDFKVDLKVGFKVDTLAMDHHVAARRPSPDGYARTPALELERADNRKRS